MRKCSIQVAQAIGRGLPASGQQSQTTKTIVCATLRRSIPRFCGRGTSRSYSAALAGNADRDLAFLILRRITLEAMPATTPQPARPRGGPLTNRILTSRWTKAAVFVACLIPGAWIIWRWQHHELGANWIEAAERGVGDWVLKFLVFTLCITPLRRLPGLSALIRYRRMLGLFAFAYACLHFFIYLWYDKGLDWRDMWGDFTTRRFYIFGLIAFVGLFPLALTSTAASIRWLGGKRWQLLHRLVYLSALAGAIHYYLQGKSIVPRAVMFIAIVVLLLLYRAVVFVRKRPARRLSTT